MHLVKYFNKKKVLITGNSGFKGKWLSLFLKELNCEVYGVSLNETTKTHGFDKFQGKIKHQYELNITDFVELKQVFEELKPEIVFHLAANAITNNSFEDPLGTISTNVMGTAHVLECLRILDNPCVAIMVTSDKCYENQEWVWGYRENDRIGGKDPYSASKGMSELLISSYYQSFFKNQTKIKIASCRAGNVIGGGDFGLMRIVPDCFRAWSNRLPIDIRNPESTRPWNYVLDVLYGYLLTAYSIDLKNLNGESFNFGPDSNSEVTVLQLVVELWKYWEDNSFTPYVLGENTNTNHEHKYLKLNKDKANRLLNWNPQMTIDKALKETADWYQEYLTKPENIEFYSIQLVRNYMEGLKLIDESSD